MTLPGKWFSTIILGGIFAWAFLSMSANGSAISLWSWSMAFHAGGLIIPIGLLMAIHKPQPKVPRYRP